MERIGLVCRWKPVHLGHAAMLEALCERAGPGGLVLVGLGSPNKHDRRNPFTAEESAAMIDLVLAPRFDNYELVPVRDLDDGPRWRELVLETFGPLDLFVTANDYVRSLLREDYRVVHPASLVPVEKHVPVDGTMVREAIARGEPWQHLVPPEVADWLVERGLVARFRREFGVLTVPGGLRSALPPGVPPLLGGPAGSCGASLRAAPHDLADPPAHPRVLA